jgi:putative heme-binding domain-containing protein
MVRLQLLLALGGAIYAVTCHACHHNDGLGQEGKAPPLVESDWVNGPPERLVRIALHGLAGPVTVLDREWNLTMPGLGQSAALDDQRMATVLTYVRRAWDNWGDPISPEMVADVRLDSAGRAHMWTAAELLGLDEASGNTVAAGEIEASVRDPLAKYGDYLDGGDAERGRVLFHTNLKQRCPACHVADETGGGFVGPDLTDVGSRAKHQYLLESLVDPSAEIVKGYDTMVILTANGAVVSGTFVSEDEKQIIIAPPKRTADCAHCHFGSTWNLISRRQVFILSAAQTSFL